MLSSHHLDCNGILRIFDFFSGLISAKLFEYTISMKIYYYIMKSNQLVYLFFPFYQFRQ